jgi:hypothetical protein
MVVVLSALYVVVAACAVALFAIGLIWFGVVAFLGLAFGLVGLAKLRRAFRSARVE